MFPFLDEENLRAHLLEFKNILSNNLGRTDLSKVPVQASLDATAVTGRFSTRESNDGDDRLLYGVETSNPFKQVRIKIYDTSNSAFESNESRITLNSLQNCPDLLEKKLIKRGKSYQAIVLLPFN